MIRGEVFRPMAKRNHMLIKWESIDDMFQTQDSTFGTTHDILLVKNYK
jgi:hypothetical protein